MADKKFAARAHKGDQKKHAPSKAKPHKHEAAKEAHKKAVQMMLPTRFPEQLKERSTAATA